jgi:endonuclease G
MPGRATPSVTDLVGVLRSRAQRWPELPNVTSVGVGYRLRRGRRTRELAIQVTVARKLTPAVLRRSPFDRLPETVRDGGIVAGVDVVERAYRPSFVVVPEPPGSTPPAPPASFPLQRRRRLVRICPGISVAHVDGSAGTIGAIVYDRRTGRPCVLSNAHVLAGVTAAADARVVQPGRFDDADVTAGALGTVLRSHVGLAGDCAIATIDTRLYDEAILELGVAPRRLAKVQLGDVVVKSGRTTGVTRGAVVRVGVVFDHDYGGSIGLRQIGGFEIGPLPGPTVKLCDEGDSGSLWMIQDPVTRAASDIAAGLHFAQQDDPAGTIDHALACAIDSVVEKLDISFSSVA